MPGVQNPRKRPSLAVSDNEDEEPYVSSASKRVRRAPDAPDAPSSSRDNGHQRENEYQPGSIVRVKLTNFVTYTSAEFHLGPSLNMIIGPNGTGKSTLVCAICLGLGWSSQYLGRAKEVGEFVKHGCAEAEIEIELAASEKQRNNPIIRRSIRKDGNKSVFHINGHPKSQRDVKALAESFSIQINNLCQFLPQDRVVEFAKMDSIGMLGETLRAAASGEMVQWHNDLKQLRSNEKEMEVKQQNEQQHLKVLQAKQNAERAEVDRYNQRQDLVAKHQALERCRPFIQFRTIKAEIDQIKKDIRKSKEELQQYEADAEPARHAEAQMEDYKNQIEQIAKHRKHRYEVKKGSVERFSSKIDKDQQSFGTHTADIDAEREAEKQRKLEMKRIKNDITNLQLQLEENVAEYDPTLFTSRLAEFRTKKNAADRTAPLLGNDIKATQVEIEQHVNTLNAKRTLKARLNSQTGQRDSLLSKLSKDTHSGWTWLKDNMDTLSLRDKVFGPPIIECSVPNSKYADAVETVLRRGDLTAITCTNSHDAQIIQNKLVGKKDAGGLGLHQISIRTVPHSRSFYKSPLTSEELAAFGFEGWLGDFIEGPDAVIAMLCETAKIHRTAFASKSMTNEQYTSLEHSNARAQNATQIQKWVAGSEVYQVTSRRDYGLSSTTVTSVRKAEYFTGQPVATTEMQKVDEEINDIQREMLLMRDSIKSKKNELAEAMRQSAEAKTELVKIQAEQEHMKGARARWERLPPRIADKESDLQEIRNASHESSARIKAIRTKHEDAALAIARLTLSYANEVTHLGALRESVLEAEIRLIEANSEVEGFKNDNREIIEAIQRQRQIIDRLTEERTIRTEEATRLKQQARRIQDNLSDFERATIGEYKDLTLQELENEISAVNSRLELMEEGNPRALKAYEDREREIERIKQTLQEAEMTLENNRQAIKNIRDQWEPELDSIVGTISDGFSHNFEKIGCAGQVGVKKDEDFDKWAIQIEVSFREGEPLAILDSHRQSGGERAVSTIFYLMALQGLARSPFRVVDEINQGMDPRNERMVHERMVDIACAERTSQYFLVTPKLLNDLKFHPKMKVHCIASGEYMPDQRTNLNFQSLAELALRVRKGIVAA